MNSDQVTTLWTLGRYDSESRYGETCGWGHDDSPEFIFTPTGTGAGIGICGNCADIRVMRWIYNQTSVADPERERQDAIFRKNDLKYDYAVAETKRGVETLTIGRFTK